MPAESASVQAAIGQLESAGLRDEDSAVPPTTGPGHFRCKDCAIDFLAQDLRSCGGQSCLNKAENLICENCSLLVETSGKQLSMCHTCANLTLRDTSDDVEMASAVPTGAAKPGSTWSTTDESPRQGVDDLPTGQVFEAERQRRGQPRAQASEPGTSATSPRASPAKRPKAEDDTPFTVLCDVCGVIFDGRQAVEGFDLGPLTIVCSAKCHKKCDREKRNRDNPRCYGCNAKCTRAPPGQVLFCPKIVCLENVLTFERFRLCKALAEDRLGYRRHPSFLLGTRDA